MRILDRHILKSILSLFFTCVFLFLFFYVVIDIISRLEDILRQHTKIAPMVKYYLFNLPAMFVQVAPFTCLLSTLYTFGKLNHDNEIIAMRSSGLSIFQITKTAIIFGFLVSIFIFWLGDGVLPRTLAVTQRLREQMDEGTKRAKEKKEIIENLAMYGSHNRLFFINKFFTLTNTMEGINILEHDEHQNVTRKIVANKGVYKDGLWQFYQSITYNFDQNGQITQEPHYAEEELADITETPQDFINQRQRPDYMTIAEMDNYIWKLSRSGATSVIRSLKVDLYQRVTGPFTSMIIILMGIPFSMMLRRRATGLSVIGLSIMVAFLYYIADAVSVALGKGGALPPLVAASLSHVIALTFSLYLIKSLP